MFFQKPPFRIDFTLPDPKTEPAGLMKLYLGPQYDSKKIADNQEVKNFTEEYEFLRAFPVIPLLGADFTVERDSELGAGLCSLLNQKLPPIEFEKVEVNPAVLRKYHFIHTSVAAPIDEATRQPMAIEISASLKDLKAPEGSYEQQLFDLLKKGDPFSVFQFKDQFKEDKTFGKKDDGSYRPGYMGHELIAEMTLQIYEAVYSNIMFPNISGGFYL